MLRAGYGVSYLFRDTSQYNFPSNQVSELNAANAYVPGGSMRAGFPAPILLAIPSNGIIPNAPTTLTYSVMPRTWCTARSSHGISPCSGNCRPALRSTWRM